MTNALTIRPIEAQDRASWAPLWTAYLKFYETTVAQEVYDVSFARMLDPADTEFNGLIAEQNGIAVGITHYLFHRHMWKVENVCYLQDLYVAPQTRGTGAGRALIEAVYEKADQAGCPSVYWLTQEFNEVGRRLYDRVGTLTPFIRYNRPS